ncbi:DUF305 domain-containing protein [Arthrobacter sp.]|uniref:DUF305 domain-containing protein n=1 Tax=Arthrobacter sp. TaxID=1667 RepID=UPI003A94324A
MMKRNFLLPALGLAAAMALAGCGTGTDPATMPSSRPGQAAASNASPESGTKHNGADTMFAQIMIPHHQQAVEMSEIMLAKDTVGPEVAEGQDSQPIALAKQIITTQQAEITKMQDLLAGL